MVAAAAGVITHAHTKPPHPLEQAGPRRRAVTQPNCELVLMPLIAWHTGSSPVGSSTWRGSASGAELFGPPALPTSIVEGARGEGIERKISALPAREGICELRPAPGRRSGVVFSTLFTVAKSGGKFRSYLNLRPATPVSCIGTSGGTGLARSIWRTRICRLHGCARR